MGLENILFGALAGVIWGGLVAALKYYLIWRPAMKKPVHESDQKSGYVIYYGIRFFISILFDLAGLLVVYFCRELLPWNYLSVLIGAAAALSVGGLVLNKTIVKREARLEKDRNR